MNLPAVCSEADSPTAGKPLSSLPQRAVPSGPESAEKEFVYMEETDVLGHKEKMDAWRRPFELEHTGFVLYLPTQ